jgi:hypothetical protein
VRRWIETHVTVAGEIEQPHVRPWSTVLRVPTTEGVVWFKAARHAFAHEARVVAILAPLAPQLLPEVIASTEQGWLLLADAGARAREQPVDWPALLREYAVLQQASAGAVDELLSAGAYDNRPERVVDGAEHLLEWLPADLVPQLRRKLPLVTERMARLAASRLPVTVDHGDLHDGNVFARAGRLRLLDWGDSGVAHPFFSLSTADPGEETPYLDAWSEHAPRNELEEEAAIVAEVRFLVRALNWEHVAALGEVEHLVDRIRWFVDPAAAPR